MLFDDIKLTVLGFVSGFLGVIVLAVSEGAICTTDQEAYPSDFYANSLKLLRYQTQRNWIKELKYNVSQAAHFVTNKRTSF